jgi:hypothetical protein
MFSLDISFTVSLFQVLTCLLLLVHLEASQPWWGQRVRPGSAADPAADRRPCPQVTTLAEANRLGCLSKYDCAQVCESKKKCRTQYEYKCTDFKRRECKDVWQNQCNGLNNGKRKKGGGESSRGRREIRGDSGGDFNGRRTRRLIPTEVVYDQSYPLPNNGLPYADPDVGKTQVLFIKVKVKEIILFS